MSDKSDIEKFLPPEEKNVDNDYKYSRDTYYELVEKGKESLELMIEVARESEHPRAFEVLSGMIKNISDVNDRLMDLNKKQKQISKLHGAFHIYLPNFLKCSENCQQCDDYQQHFFSIFYCTSNSSSHTFRHYPPHLS